MLANKSSEKLLEYITINSVYKGEIFYENRLRNDFIRMLWKKVVVYEVYREEGGTRINFVHML